MQGHYDRAAERVADPGALAHNGCVILPYAMSDSASSIAMVPLADLLAAMKKGIGAAAHR